MRTALALSLSLALAACDAAPLDETPATWSMAWKDLPSALLSVWGSSARDVFIVGSDPKTGDGPFVAHWDGTAMTRLATGQSGTLWWVSGTSSSGPVYMSGEAGLALRYDRAAGTFTKLSGAPDGVTLFGIFPAPGGHVWAVGSETRTNTGHVYTLDGDALVEAADLPAGVGDASPFFKVWGRSDTDLWVVGLGQKILHRGPDGWRVFTAPTIGGRLFTVHGNASLTLAVGGFISGAAVMLSAEGATDITPEGAEQLNGIWVEPSGSAIAVGTGGHVWQRAADGAWDAVHVPTSLLDYHGVYVDPDGGVWAVGGFVLSEPLRQGMLLHYGQPLPAL